MGQMPISEIDIAGLAGSPLAGGLGRLPTPVGIQASAAGPGLGSLGNEVFVAWTGTGTAQQVHVTTYQRQANGLFSVVGTLDTPEGAVSNPAIIGFAGHVYLGWTGNNAGQNLNIEQIQ